LTIGVCGVNGVLLEILKKNKNKNKIISFEDERREDVVGRKKILFLCSKEKEIGEGLFFYFFISLIIMTWKGSLEEKKNKLFWGHFIVFCLKKLGIVFGKVCFSQV